MMSWEEYDAIKRGGGDPEEVSYRNMNKPKPWERDRGMRRG